MQVFSLEEGLEFLVVLPMPRYELRGFYWVLLLSRGPWYCRLGASHRCLMRCRFRVHLDSLNVVLKARYPACVAALDEKSWVRGLQALLLS